MLLRTFLSVVSNTNHLDTDGMQLVVWIRRICNPFLYFPSTQRQKQIYWSHIDVSVCGRPFPSVWRVLSWSRKIYVIVAQCRRYALLKVVIYTWACSCLATNLYLWQCWFIVMSLYIFFRELCIKHQRCFKEMRLKYSLPVTTKSVQGLV